jgi:hypothetical protein
MTTQTTHNTPPTIQTRRDLKRGCGWRHPGGLYLVAPAPAQSCGRLPQQIWPCPMCGHRLNFTRGWQWITPSNLLSPEPCKNSLTSCATCPLKEPAALPRSGLLWVGRTHYRTTTKFLVEATQQGISKPIPRIPKDFHIGDTAVFLAHPTGCVDEDTGEPAPAIFAWFTPQAIEYAVHPNDTPEHLERLQAKGVTLIEIERIEPEPPLIPDALP